MFFSAAVCSCPSINEDDDSDCCCSDRVVKNEDSDSGMNCQHFLKANEEVVMSDHILTQLWDEKVVVEMVIWDTIDTVNNSNMKKSSDIVTQSKRQLSVL